MNSCTKKKQKENEYKKALHIIDVKGIFYDFLTFLIKNNVAIINTNPIGREIQALCAKPAII